MLRSLLLAALVLLFTGPALAQDLSAQFQVVSADDASMDGLPVLVYSEDGSGEAIAATVGADGAVTVNVPSEGAYFAYVAPEGDALTVIAFPALASEGGTEQFAGILFVSAIDPAMGIVRGLATDATSGEPTRHQFMAVSADGIEGLLPAAIDGEGRYAFQVDPATYDAAFTTYTFSDNATVYRPAMASFTASAGQTTMLDLTFEAREIGALAGVVTDAETGAPVAGAYVTAHAVDGTSAGFTTSGDDGSYSLDLPENDYIVFVEDSEAGYLTQYFDGVTMYADATPVTVAASGTRADVDFALGQPDADFAVTLSGMLVDADGAPLNGVVTIYDDGGSSDVFAVVDGVIDASADHPSLAGSELVVGFEADGYEPEFFDDSPTYIGAQLLMTGTSAVAFDLGTVTLTAEGDTPEGLTISGTIRSDETGQPIEGAIVSAQRLDAPGIRYGVSDASGRYDIHGLDAGDYAVLFTQANHIPEFYPDVATWTEAEVIDLDADRPNVNGLMGGLNRPVGANLTGAPYASKEGVEVRGVVRDDDGAALAGALVTATGADGIEAYALTDGAGRFALNAESDLVSVASDRGRFERETTTVRTSTGGQLFVTMGASSVVSNEAATETRSTALRVFPNPTRGQTTVALAFESALTAEVTVYDVLGRKVLSETALNGAGHVTLDTAALAPGRYIVRAVSGDQAEVQPLTVVR